MANRRAKVRLQSMTLCRTARVYDHGKTMDLLAVSPRLFVDPQFEFPRFFTRLDLHAGFLVDGAGTGVFSLRLWWNSPDRSRQQKCRVFEPDVVEFSGEESIQDHVFKMTFVTFDLPGLYSIQLCQRIRKPFERRRWKTLGWTLVNVGALP
jgi:hypothetical protein